jgi:hypothetical protein
MFRTVLCSSSGGHIVLLQHLLSPLSVKGRIIRPPEDEHSTARNMSRIVM